MRALLAAMAMRLSGCLGGDDEEPQSSSPSKQTTTGGSGTTSAPSKPLATAQSAQYAAYVVPTTSPAVTFQLTSNAKLPDLAIER